MGCDGRVGAELMQMQTLDWGNVTHKMTQRYCLLQTRNNPYKGEAEMGRRQERDHQWTFELHPGSRENLSKDFVPDVAHACNPAPWKESCNCETAFARHSECPDQPGVQRPSLKNPNNKINDVEMGMGVETITVAGPERCSV